MTVHEFITKSKKNLIGKNIKKIIVDEYLFFGKEFQRDFYELMQQLDVNVTIRTTSDRLYKKELIDLTNCLKISDNPCVLFKHIKAETLKEIMEYYWYNLLFEGTFNVFSGDRHKGALNEEQYKIEILGEWQI